MEDDVCFIDKTGRRFRCDTIASHIGLANLMLEEMSELAEEFKKSGKQDPVDFLISNKGYIKVTNQGLYDKIVVYDSASVISKQQRGYLIHYRELGFRLEDLEATRRKNKSRLI